MRSEYMPSPERVQAFWTRVDRNGPVPAHRPELGPCWLWTGTTNGHYGTLTVPRPLRASMGKSLYVHRLSYALAYGPVPDGLFVLHKCDTPRCVNPAHLWAGTPRENTQDAVKKGRLHGPDHPASQRGELNARAKVTADDVRAMRFRRATEQTPWETLAAEYGLHPITVRQIVNGVYWGWLQDGLKPKST